MEQKRLIDLLERYRTGDISLGDILDQLKTFPYEALNGYAHLDHHRAIRTGFPEVIFGLGKTPEQIRELLLRLMENNRNVLATRIDPAVHLLIKESIPAVQYHPIARILFVESNHPETRHPGILVITAGTSDIPVAEEAAITAELMGNQVERIFDVGVAGIHRLLSHFHRLQSTNVIVVVAGMEGALPSVVGGLTPAPVIAVPTSIGYGASFHGLAALLGMLNSCANGVSVVNIDNGYGAGCMAAKINRLSLRTGVS